MWMDVEENFCCNSFSALHQKNTRSKSEGVFFPVFLKIQRKYCHELFEFKLEMHFSLSLKS